jgi:hypothetical protein
VAYERAQLLADFVAGVVAFVMQSPIVLAEMK